ncbi:hypothetical protein T11_8468 [Trichinella zimbabwensis]|uniref:Uncharacterized protein n=1 Tax=Trichinella zimbabwensis TaxID=268475 RepID=A0A0V1H240_9BILA|nr:hypothetical protein T11_8468 [Trichinella zimbabwensis]
MWNNVYNNAVLIFVHHDYDDYGLTELLGKLLPFSSFPVDCLPCGCFVITPPTHDIPGAFARQLLSMINRNRVLFVRVASLAAPFTHGWGLHCYAIGSVIRLGQAIDGVFDPYAWAQHIHAFDVLGASRSSGQEYRSKLISTFCLAVKTDSRRKHASGTSRAETAAMKQLRI